MAKSEMLLDHILKWETGVIKKSGESYDAYFERCKKKGWANDPLDRGGATNCGLTLKGWQTYCHQHKLKTPTVTELKAITFEQWHAVYKQNYWDRYKADQIVSQSVANILVDYLWGSGSHAITKVQAALGLKADGIVGPKTLAMINGKSALTMFGMVKEIRRKHYEAIVRSNPSQQKWLKGWMNRLNDIKFVG